MWKSKIFWKTSLLHIIIVLTLLGTMLAAARLTLPDISREKYQNITDTVAKQIKEQVENIHQYMRETESAIDSNTDLRQEEDGNELNHDLSELTINPLVDSVTILDRNGEVVGYYPNGGEFLKGDQLAHKDYFLQARQDKTSYVSDAFISSEGRPVLVIAVPLVNANGDVERVVCVTMNLAENRYLSTMFQNVQLGSDGYIYIVDRNGRLISHPDKRLIGQDASQNPVVHRVITEKGAGYQQVTNPQGEEMYASYDFASELGWGIVAQVPVEETMMPYYTFRDSLWIVLAVLFLPLALLSAFYARQMIKPIRSLYEAVDHVAKGDYEQYIDKIDNTEIGQVSQRFNEMIRYIRDAKERIQYQANHDPLTGLPNRVLLHEQLLQKLEEAKQADKCVAVMFLDLDRFKNINDTLGHSIGDRFLIEVSKRVQKCLRKKDILARVGGDEFIALMPNFDQLRDVIHIPQLILDSFQEPFEIDGYELYMSTSIGISLYPEDGKDLETLIKNADMAMYRAKEHGRNNYQLHTEAMNEAASERMVIETSLRRALERDELVLFYQPKIDLKSGAMVGMEALIRWKHPEWGMVPPGRFIPVAEDTGLIVPIGEWVIRTACRQNKDWQLAGYPPMRVSVNLSALQFQRPNLVEQVARILDEIELDPEWLEVEITESLLMQNIDMVIETLEAFKAIGVHLSIDDFGTGYSSLSYLEKFPIDSLKIDQSFVRSIRDEASDAQIAKAIISLGHSLNLHVIAEGVETEAQLEFLRNQQCDAVQGYLFSKPIPADEFQIVLTDMVSNIR